jgi:hypothetical protein
MKTAHQFARELLDGPDLPIAIMSGFLADHANEPAVTMAIMDWDDKKQSVLLISAAITLRDGA